MQWHVRVFALTCVSACLLSAQARSADFEYLLPPKTDIFVTINLKQIIESPAFRKVAPGLAKNFRPALPREAPPALKAVWKMAGSKEKVLGLANTLKGVFTRMTVVGKAGDKDPQLMAFEGTWNQPTAELFLLAAASNEKGQVLEQDGWTVARVPSNDKMMYAVAVADGLVLAGFEMATVTAAASAYKKKKAPDVSAAFLRLVKAVDQNNSVVVCGIAPGDSDVSVDVKVTKGIALEGKFVAPNAALAMNFGAGFAKAKDDIADKVKMLGRANPYVQFLSKAIGDASSSVNGKDIKVELKVSEAEIDKLVKATE